MKSQRAPLLPKEELYTFLQAQPTIIFGRTARELLILACGGSAAYALWQSTVTSGETLWGMLFSGLLCAFVIILSILAAFVTYASRSVEEWITVFFAYLVIPKLYLYQRGDENWAEISSITFGEGS